MLVGSDPFLFSRRDQIVAMAARAGIPAVYNDSRYVQAGGLMSYGTIPSDAFQQLCPRRPLGEAQAALDDLRAGRVVGRVVLTT